jgi:hypothetical protein
MLSEPKFTYLFGAGASANALPTIYGLKDRIKALHNLIRNVCDFGEEKTNMPGYDFKLYEAKDYLLIMLNELYEICESYTTIDTYAKQLSISHKHEQLERISFALSVYFSIDQKISNKDRRYETFFISLLEDSIYNFPKNIKFLSWNYDLQMEYAYEKITESKRFLNSPPFFNRPNNLTFDDFSSIKINGSCAMRGKSEGRYTSIVDAALDKYLKNSDLNFILNYAYIHFKLGHEIFDRYPNLNFAWYNEEKNLNKWKEIHKLTDILVVIGYSFPFFNRHVDREIIREMVNLKKIYIQDINPDNIISRFLSVLPDYKKQGIEIIPINNVEEFFLPPEL